MQTLRNTTRNGIPAGDLVRMLSLAAVAGLGTAIAAGLVVLALAS